MKTSQNIYIFLIPAFFALPCVQTFAESAHVLSEIRHDWNGDGIEDKIQLIENKTDDNSGDSNIDVRFQLSNKSAKPDEIILRNNTGKNWSPKLSLNKTHSAVLDTNNEEYPSGTAFWWRKATFSFRNNEFFVSGLTDRSIDKMTDEHESVECDINLLTGNYVYNGKKGHLRAGTWPLSVKDYADQKREIPSCE